MSEPGGSLTAIFRKVRSGALFYEYPRSPYSGRKTNHPINEL